MNSQEKKQQQPYEGGITDPEVIAYLERKYPPPPKESPKGK
jgi:hypothetical protein